MLRALLLYLSQAAWARRLVTRWSIGWRVASRFIAGETLEAAVKAVKELNRRGLFATLDHLGEHTSNPAEARESVREILEIIDVVAAERLQSGISIKLTQIGLALDESLCEANLREIAAHAAKQDVFVRIDMEDSPYLEKTLRLFDRMLDEFGTGHIGIVLQSYLYRTVEDTRKLMEKGARIRIVKGAYKEPPEIAFPDKKDVDAEFDKVTDVLLEGVKKWDIPLVREDGRVPPIPAIASQDDLRIDYAKQALAAAGLPRQAIEFQMLYGIRRDLQDGLVAEGYPVRIYVPFGTEWYPYFVRRLAERPANLWFFVSNFFKR